MPYFDCPGRRSPILIWGRGGDDSGTKAEALALSDAGRASYHQQKMLSGPEGLPPVPVVMVRKDGILLFQGTETRLHSPVEYPSMLDMGIPD